ncbi:MAG TPA: GGDEF domain-containing protein [Gammaproteobacteria bacterium]|nr:GGDEF domain-containing protein [Gammaproteobacteria bacterium]
MSDKSSRKADLWQRKYYQSLDELEQKEKQWQEIESLLRLLASRLTLLSDATDEQLEKKLDTLRSNLRYEDNALKFRPLVNDISATIANADAEIKVKKTSSELQSAMSLNKLLDEFKIPSVLQRQEKHVRKRLGQARSEKDLVELIKDMAELLGLTIDHLVEQKCNEVVTGDGVERPAAAVENKTDEKTGFLKKLFSGAKDEAEEAAKIRLPEATENTAAALDFQANLPLDISQDKSIDLNAGADTIELSVTQLTVEGIGYAADILIELLEKLDLPHDLCVEAGLIRQRLQPCHEQEKLAQGIEATAALVAEAHSRILDEKKELETFLQQLTQRLQEIDTDLQETVRLQQLSITGSREVNAAVEEEVRGIEQSVETARDLSMLQTDIQSRVIIIRDHMDRFLRAELLRDSQSGDISDRLKKELAEAEEEIEVLRRQLDKEREQSMKDALTGLFNRKAYDQYINDELARFRRYGSPFVLAVWDVDHFKSVNDQYGHVAGDKVLKIIATIIAENTRETDIAARYGGEEFAVIMPETTIKAAYKSVEKLREIIQNCAFHFRGQRVLITASCGITEVRENDTPESIFQRADSGLYRAKEKGRNRCEIVE